jgi:hypothetical protein
LFESASDRFVEITTESLTALESATEALVAALLAIDLATESVPPVVAVDKAAEIKKL